MIKKKKLLLTGASGFLGWNIYNQAPEGWEIFGTYFSHPFSLSNLWTVEADLRNYRELKDLFKTVKPTAVIHTAAITDPNYCQLFQKETEAINCTASLALAGLCADHQTPLVFTSSDLVFDGSQAPYSENDPLCPINIYGEQKARAEVGMKERYPATIICRLPLMFGNPGMSAQSFIQPMLKAIQEDRPLNLFIDEFRTPVSGKTAAQGIFLAMDKAEGIIHLGGRDRISRYDFGLLLKNVLGAYNTQVIPCRQKDIPMAAPRPADVSLSSHKALSLGFDPPSLMEDLKDCLGRGYDLVP
jgi:dTDP-4-dehydrorhamnose reductase